jgi:phosphoribosyl-ATP pyrophosphohydrolase/phosphoribosyl-AMP cyclohydrolase
MSIEVLPSRDALAGLDWNKGDGRLLPVVVQDADTLRVLMLGYANAEALEQTLASGQMTFYSRSKQRLWTKGESSGNVLTVTALRIDCDNDTLLVSARPAGPTCHTGSESCFPQAPGNFLGKLDAVVREREQARPDGSYTTTLFEQGTRRIAQKVGEEGVETALAGVVQDDAALLGESADLLFHLIVLLRARGLSLDDAVSLLASRHAK